MNLVKNHGCPHLAFHKTPETMLSLQTIIGYSLRFRHRHLLNDPSDAKKRKVFNKLCQLPTPYCHRCNDPLGNVHACLHCIFIGCSTRQHIRQHLTERNHNLALDFCNFTIFCLKCGDYVYDFDFEEIVRLERIRFDETFAVWNEPKTSRRTQYLSWKPNSVENSLILEKSRLHSHTAGLRGLRNLGNTCFMNVILQCLVHNPPFRSFFMSDMHNPKSCTAEETDKCLACQMDGLFNQFYSGETCPIIPNEFLWAMWMSCTELIGYAQQDAHEFFIGLLDSLHSAIAPSAFQFGNPQLCPCIIHRIFAGTFQSCVTCMRCGNASIALDPFLDISLDVRPVFSPATTSLSPSESASLFQNIHQNPAKEPNLDLNFNSSPLHSIKSNQHKSETVLEISSSPIASSDAKSKKHDRLKVTVNTSSIQTVEIHSLQECLDQFTHKERLNISDYKCSACQSNPHQSSSNGSHQTKGAYKQLSLKKLPLVLSFQLKRFDHMNLLHRLNGNQNLDGSGGNGRGGKLNMLIKFPLDLDMTRWTTQELSKSSSSPAKNQSKIKISNPSHQYSLFAVIVHHGTLQSGHYICYVRQSGMVGKWFRFDDHMVTIAEWEEVSNCEAYMLFYIKKTFEYQS